jgi:predicted amidohydrolase YtcJ
MIKARIPLLHDRHTHVSFYASLGAAADLSACRSLGAALAVLRKAPGKLKLGRGWRNNFYDLAGPRFDALGPTAVCNLSLHNFAFNRPARELLAGRYPDVMAGLGDPAWVERNLDRVFEIFTVSAGAGAIPAYLRSLARLGVWSCGDMLVSSDEAALLLARRYRGRVTLWSEPGCYEKLGRAARAAVTGLKIFTDGAIGARTAALEGRYKGGGRGLLLHGDRELRSLIRRCGRLKDELAVHAIGGAAIGQLLRALETPGVRRRGLKVRVEHAQLITPEQARRAKRLGLTLCMQPNFSSDSACYADRLPARCLRANNPFRMLIDRAGFVPGEDLVFGSDGMPHGAAAALREALFPPCPGQRLTLGEFTDAYCLPDLKAGWLDVTVDPARRRVTVKVGGAAAKP